MERRPPRVDLSFFFHCLDKLDYSVGELLTHSRTTKKKACSNTVALAAVWTMDPREQYWGPVICNETYSIHRILFILLISIRFDLLSGAIFEEFGDMSPDYQNAQIRLVKI